MVIVNTFLEKGILLDSDLQDIMKNINPSIENEIADILSTIASKKEENQRFLSKKDLTSNIININLALENLKRSNPENKAIFDQTISFLSSLSPNKKLVEEDGTKKFKLEKEIDLDIIESQTKNVLAAEPINIIKSFSIPPRKIVVQDFVKHFRNRFNSLRKILHERIGSDMISIDKIGNERQQANIIGMVSSKSITKNKNLIFEIEDLSGTVKVLVNKDRNTLYHQALEVVLDEVIGLKCVGNSEIMFVTEIIFPDLLAKKIKTNYDEYALFIADLHVGSTNFLEENFLRFIKWINGEIGSENQKEIAKKVKYLFVVGDVIDGVGVHPLQEPLLEIKDVIKQYEKTAELFGKIRKDVNIIMCPGNHDALRIAEPQPQFHPEYAKSLYELGNIFFVSNPATISIRGVNILLYHGFSFDYFIHDVDSLRTGNAYHNPKLIPKFLLKKRHLAPTHTATQYIPCEDEDPLLIGAIPDVFVSAHIHRPDISSYNNLLTIACSCWQSKTPLEEKMGHEPDPGKVPILHLKTGEVKIIDFS